MPSVGSLLRKFFLVDLAKGLWLTLKYTPQPAFTFQYPKERRQVAPRYRGVLRLQVDPQNGAQTCIVCDQCAKACPDDLIWLGGHREPGQKIKVDVMPWRQVPAETQKINTYDDTGEFDLDQYWAPTFVGP